MSPDRTLMRRNRTSHPRPTLLPSPGASLFVLACRPWCMTEVPTAMSLSPVDHPFRLPAIPVSANAALSADLGRVGSVVTVACPLPFPFRFYPPLRCWSFRHPRKILLFRQGDFYEALGHDAVQLVEHAGLNPMSGAAGRPRFPRPAVRSQTSAPRFAP